MTAMLLRVGPWLLLVTILLLAAALALGLTTRVGAQQFAVQPPLAAIASAALALAYAVVGAVLTARLPRNPIGWLLTGAGFFIALNAFTWYYLTNSYETIPPKLVATGEVGIIGQVAGTPLVLLCIGAALGLFPDGHLISPRWRWLPVVAFVGLSAYGVSVGLGSREVPYFAGVPNPFFMELLPGPLVVGLRVLGAGIALALMVAAAWSLILRYRLASDERRHQVRWIAYAAVIMGMASVLMIIGFNLAGPSDLGPRSDFTAFVWLVFCAGAITIPVAFLVAITRYRLYAIDRIISGTIVYAGLVAILAGIYAGLNDLLKRAFIAVTGEQSDAALVITTLVLAMTLTPVRQWLERLAAKRFGTHQATAPGGAPGEAMAAAPLDEATVERIAERAAELSAARVLAEMDAKRRGVRRGAG